MTKSWTTDRSRRWQRWTWAVTTVKTSPQINEGEGGTERRHVLFQDTQGCEKAKQIMKINKKYSDYICTTSISLLILKPAGIITNKNRTEKHHYQMRWGGFWLNIRMVLGYLSSISKEKVYKMYQRDALDVPLWTTSSYQGINCDDHGPLGSLWLNSIRASARRNTISR